MNYKLVVVVLMALVLSACASSGKLVSRGNAYKSITHGTITDTEEVTIGGSQSGVGGYIVSAAAIHDASSDSFFGFLARALVGSAVGAAAEEIITRKPGMRYMVDTSQGRAIEVVSPNLELKKGDCVQIARGRRQIDISLSSTGSCAAPVKT